MTEKELTLDSVYKASYVLRDVVRKTDVLYAPKLAPGLELYLKTENLQVTGSFKVRGACYKMSQLSAEEKAKGVIACSAGNHAQGVALAAQKNGIRAVICLPNGAPISKVEATRSYGAEICLVDGVYDDAYQKALELQNEFGYTAYLIIPLKRLMTGSTSSLLRTIIKMVLSPAIVPNTSCHLRVSIASAATCALPGSV